MIHPRHKLTILILFRFPKTCKFINTILQHYYFVGQSNSVTLTSSNIAVSLRVSKFGCMVFVHHFETVPSSLPSWFANHLLVFFLFCKNNFKAINIFGHMHSIFSAKVDCLIYCSKLIEKFYPNI